MITYTGYVYLWFDTKARLFYVGGHHGKVNDSYVCSSPTMKRAYLLRPDTFRFRVLEYVNGSTDDLRAAEQRWLDLIKPTETLITENVQAGTHRYYNVKLNAAGGNGKGTNKGNSNIGGHNRKTWRVTKPDGTSYIVTRSKQFAEEQGIIWGNLLHTLKMGKPRRRGPTAGWILELVSEEILLPSSPPAP